MSTPRGLALPLLAAPAPLSPATGYSRGEEAAGALGQPQTGQEADGEDEDEEEEISQPPGRRGRLRHARPPPQPHQEMPRQPSAVALLTGNTRRKQCGRPAR